jgi:hypothetical protein
MKAVGFVQLYRGRGDVSELTHYSTFSTIKMTVKCESQRSSFMRSVILGLLIAGVSACSSGTPTGPRGPVLNVRVIDDAGAPVDRMPIKVTMSEDSRVDGRTGRDGTADIRLTAAGTYEVRVIPRDGYLAGIEPLSKTVTVEANGAVTLTFTVHRAGVSTADPKPETDPNRW